jgi:TonB family protein
MLGRGTSEQSRSKLWHVRGPAVRWRAHGSSGYRSRGTFRAVRPAILGILILFAAAPLASAQARLDAADRAPLRAEPGVLVHPSLGFRLRDIGLPPDVETGAQIADMIGQSPGAEVTHGWAYARGEDLVRVVLSASDAPHELSREMARLTEARFVELGATSIERSEEGGASVVTLRFGARSVVVRALPFRAGERGLVVMVTAVLQDASLARTVAASLEVPPPPLGSLLRDTIRATISGAIEDVRRCYEAALASRPTLTGRVMVRFIIGADGSVQTATISSTTLGDEGAERCIADVVRGLRFPPPDGGEAVGVNYPFVLTPQP